MPNHKIPYYPMYPADWDDDPNVIKLPATAEWLYFKIVNLIWRNGGSYPYDQRLISREVRWGEKVRSNHRGINYYLTLLLAKNCLFVNADMLFCPRTTIEWNKAAGKSQAAQKAAYL